MTGRFRPAYLLGVFLGTAAFTSPVIAGEQIIYTYDALGRLIAVSRTGTVNNGIEAAYAYDKADNRTNVTVTTSVPAAPSFSIDNVSVTEGSSLTFTVTRTGSTASTLTVNYASASGTATSGSDFTAGSGTLSFAPGDITKTVSIATIDDSSAESSETMSVTLSAPSGGATIGTGTGTGTINDNDSAPACQGVAFAVASNGAVTEGASSAFTVTKTGSATGSCAVSYATASGTATSGSDFTAKSGTLTFTSAQTSQSVSVTTTDDTSVESAETFTLNLSGATNGATISTAAATATINDNDSAAVPSFAISDASDTEGTSLVFVVTRSGPTTGSYTVNYATANGTATGLDFTATSGTLTFASGETSKTISVLAKSDASIEADETFSVNLSAPSGGAALSDSQGIGTIYDDGGGGCLVQQQAPESDDAAASASALPPC